jgi:hypothetical protein
MTPVGRPIEKSTAFQEFLGALADAIKGEWHPITWVIHGPGWHGQGHRILTVGIKVDYDLDPKCGVTLYTKKERKTIACGTVRGKPFYMIADNPSTYHVNSLQITDRAHNLLTYARSGAHGDTIGR